MSRTPAPVYPPDWDVPQAEHFVFAPKAARHALVIPVINEGERIRRQLARQQEQGVPGLLDVVVADGGSSDGSLDHDFLRKKGVRALLVKQGPGRQSAQLRMAYAWCLSEGYEGIVTIDGNDKDGVEAIPAFVRALCEGVDYAQASRFLPGGQGVNTPPLRHVAIRLLHAPLVSLAARRWLTDTTQGFRAYSRRYLLHEKVRPFRAVFQGYELLWYLSAKASRLGLSVREIATERRYPAAGPTPTKISAWRGNWEVLRGVLRLLAGEFEPREDGR